DEPAGQVLSTDPSAGDSVPEGSLVTVFYSDGPEQVPGVVGLKQAEAERVLRDAGFEPQVVETTDTRQPKGTVINQSPDAGEDAREGSTVTIVVSAFEKPTKSPSPTPTPPPEPTPTPTETVPPTQSPTVQRSLPRRRGQRSGSA
ncbi:MAG TPA: PASTA domain-containing protein, partial [Nocardioides sp.]|nr:PASTA domain-containing protein [Nocardioides sp.]